jgi:hypothetical protein
MQNRRRLQHCGIRGFIGLIGPIARQGNGARLFIEKREHFSTANLAPLQNQEPFSQQGMEWVRYRGPSQMVTRAECSLLRAYQY